MTINASELVNLGPKRLAEVLDSLRRREKLVTDQRTANVTVSRLGRAIAELDAKVGRIVAGDVAARPLATIKLPPKKASGRTSHTAKRRPDLATAMKVALKDKMVPLRPQVLAEKVVEGGYPGEPEDLIGAIAKIAKAKTGRFIVGPDGRLRLAGGSLKLPKVASKTKSKPASKAAAPVTQPKPGSAPDFVLRAMPRDGGKLRLKEITQRAIEAGYKGKSKTPNVVLQVAVSKMVGRHLRRVGKGVYRLAEPVKA